MSHKSISAFAATAMIAAFAGAPATAGASVERSGGVFPFSFAVTNPCNGEPGTLSGADTVSTFIDDTPNHFLYENTTQTAETFTPDDATEPSAGGHGTSHTSFVDNHAGGAPFSGTTVVTDVSTSVFHAPGATVVIHNVAHVTVAGGTLVVSINRPVLVCQGG